MNEAKQQAFELGMRLGLADEGLSPSELVLAMRKQGEQKTAGGPLKDIADTMLSAIKTFWPLAIAVPAIAGGLGGVATANLTARSPDDIAALRREEEIRQLRRLAQRARLNTAWKMRDNARKDGRRELPQAII